MSVSDFKGVRDLHVVRYPLVRDVPPEREIDNELGE